MAFHPKNSSNRSSVVDKDEESERLLGGDETSALIMKVDFDNCDEFLFV